MARKSTGRTGRRSVRSSASSTRSKDNQKRRSRGSSSRGSASQHGSNEQKVVSISHGRKQGSAWGRSSGASRSVQTSVLADHDEIRRWADERGAHPSCVCGIGGGEDVGMIRLDFPGYSGEKSLEEISWDEWFSKFDESGLVLVVQQKTSRGQKSNFNKLVKRETVEAMQESAGGRSRKNRVA